MSWYFTDSEMSFVRNEKFKMYADTFQFMYNFYNMDIFRKIVEIGSIFDFFDLQFAQKEFAKAIADSKILISSSLINTCFDGMNILAQKTYDNIYVKYTLKNPVYFSLKSILSQFYYENKINSDQYRLMFINPLKGNGIERLTEDSIIDNHIVVRSIEQITYKNRYTVKAAKHAMLAEDDKSQIKTLADFCSNICSKQESDMHTYYVMTNVYKIIERHIMNSDDDKSCCQEQLKQELSLLDDSKEINDFINKKLNITI